MKQTKSQFKVKVPRIEYESFHVLCPKCGKVWTSETEPETFVCPDCRNAQRGLIAGAGAKSPLPGSKSS